MGRFIMAVELFFSLSSRDLERSFCIDCRFFAILISNLSIFTATFQSVMYHNLSFVIKIIDNLRRLIFLNERGCQEQVDFLDCVVSWLRDSIFSPRLGPMSLRATEHRYLRFYYSGIWSCCCPKGRKQPGQSPKTKRASRITHFSKFIYRLARYD